jgi:aspartate/methionine/tyrosine aminotransferase
MTKFAPNEIMSLVGAAPRYDLAESYGPDLQLGDLIDAGSLSKLVLGYGTPGGSPALRQAIGEMVGAGPDDVVVTVGGMQALFLAGFVLLGPGDEAVTTSPLFPQARNVLEAVGATIRTVPLSFEQGYRPTLGAFDERLSARTKLVSLASPQNPSGVALSPAFLADLLALMARRCPAAHLLVDETYREAAYGETPAAASAVALDRRVISTASLSKAHGAPGLRLGWAVTRDAALREQLVLAKFNTVIACSTVDEALALALVAKRQPILAERRRRMADGLRRVAAWVETHADQVEWVRPDAGAICCLRLKPARFDAAAVARFATELAEEGVRVADGAWFGDEARVFRLGFGLLSMSDLDAALKGLSTALERLQETQE